MSVKWKTIKEEKEDSSTPEVQMEYNWSITELRTPPVLLEYGSLTFSSLDDNIFFHILTHVTSTNFFSMKNF